MPCHVPATAAKLINPVYFLTGLGNDVLNEEKSSHHGKAVMVMYSMYDVKLVVLLTLTMV